MIDPIKMHIRLVLLSVLLPLVTISLKAQHDYIETAFYSVNNGLSDRSVTNILQTSDGLMWMATPSGLNKFDGYEFTIFNDHPNNANQISAANVEWIAEVADKQLFIQYENNLVSFDLLDLNSYELRKINLLDNGVKGIVRHIAINNSGTIQVLSQTDTTYNIYQLNEPDFDLLFQIPFTSKRKSIYAKFLQLDNQQFLINDNVTGLRLFNQSGQLIKHFKTKDFDSDYYPSAYPNRINFIHQSKDGTVWLAFAKISCIFQLDTLEQKLTQFLPLASRRIFRRIWEDKAGNLMVEQSSWRGGTSVAAGMYCIKNNGETENYNFLLKDRNTINDLYSKDFTKEIFLGQSIGLRILQNNQAKIKTFLATNEYNRRGAFLRGIVGNRQSDVFFAADNGKIYQIDLINDQLSDVPIVDETTGTPLQIYCPYNLHYDADSNWLWSVSCESSSSGSLNRIDLDFCTSKTYLFENNFKGFVKGQDGNFWLIAEDEDSRGSLVSFNPTTEVFTTFADTSGINPLHHTKPRYILESADQILWIGTDNGLMAVNRDSLTSTIYDKDNLDLTSNSVYVIHEDNNGLLWLGTTNGLNIFNPGNKTVETYDKSHGLASNTVCGIIQAAENQFWISTYYGLSHFDYNQKLFHNFYQLDGFSHDEFNRFSFYQDNSGRCFFGGVDGLNVFYPEVLLERKDAPQITLTKFVKYNSNSSEPEVYTNNLTNLRKVVLSPYNTYFQFNFTFPDYKHSSKNQYSAWLEGFDKDWIYLGNTPTVRYNKLPAGNYTLHINGAGPNGNWSDQYLSLNIKVKPFFYKTWWFILLLSIISAGLIYGIFQYQLEQRVKMQEIRVKLSSDLHDEMSGLLSGIAMQSDILQMMAKDEESKSRLKSIGQVSRKAMSKMSDVIWSIDSRKDRVQDLLQRMHEHADEILLPLNIKYNFSIKKLEENKRIPVHIRQNLYFIFKEAINNVAKHSNATRVDISIGNNGSNFEMTVKDNGTILYEKPIPKTGQGLSNLKMRAARIDASLDIIRKNGFSIQLKMKKLA